MLSYNQTNMSTSNTKLKLKKRPTVGTTDVTDVPTVPVAVPVAVPTVPVAVPEEQKTQILIKENAHLEPSRELKDKSKPEISTIIMNENFVLIDTIYRSRMTLLDILDSRGYDVEKYRKFSPAEATEASHNLAGLNFVVYRKDDPTYVCDVRYINLSYQRMESFFRENVTDDVSDKTEMIFMMDTAVSDRHHATAFKQYMMLKDEPDANGVRQRRKLRISFFQMDMIVINPLLHVLVPKHEIVPESEHKALMASMFITAKSKFPEIKFHTDPIARCIGAVPGDIVKITRSSASSGESTIYRVCSP